MKKRVRFICVLAVLIALIAVPMIVSAAHANNKVIQAESPGDYVSIIPQDQLVEVKTDEEELAKSGVFFLNDTRYKAIVTEND